MPARKPPTVRTRDQLVAHDTATDAGKERMIGELARVSSDAGQRLAAVESSLAALATKPKVSGSRSSGAALDSLLDALTALDLITDETTP